jgi:hypothetical protein
MLGPQYEEWPRGQGLKAQTVYIIDIIARLVVSLLLLWFVVVALLGTGR